MGRQLGLKIVAEGVETQEQLQFLATHGCTLAQGFYIARPVEAAEMAKMLRIGSNAAPMLLIAMPREEKALDVPLADYEAEMLLKVAGKGWHAVRYWPHGTRCDAGNVASSFEQVVEERV